MPTPNFRNMSSADWINLANLGSNVIGGIAQGKQAERQAGESAQEFALRQQQELIRQAEAAYQRRASARSGIGAAIQDQTLARRDAASQTLGAMPLGNEQDLVRRMARLRGLSDVSQTFKPAGPTDPNLLSRMGPMSNPLKAFTTDSYRQSISPEATARSIAERRKAIAGVNPDFQFGNMSDFGVPNLGGEVQNASNRAGADRLARENQLMQLLTNQMQEASQPLYGTGSAASQPNILADTAKEPEKKKGTPWWKKVLKVASVAAPIVAAPFTGGASLALIGAGAGAANAALNGGGVKGALMGAGMGALTSGIGGGAAGSAAKRGLDETASAAIRRAVLNPRALTSMAGAGIGGGTGGALQTASMFLPGAAGYRPRGGFEGPNMDIMGNPAYGNTAYANSPGSAPPLASSMRPPVSPYTANTGTQIPASVRSAVSGMSPRQGNGAAFGGGASGGRGASGSWGNEAPRTGANLNRHPSFADGAMPLVQSGMGFVPNPQRMMESVGDADGGRQMGRLSAAGTLTSAITGGLPFIPATAGAGLVDDAARAVAPTATGPAANGARFVPPSPARPLPGNLAPNRAPQLNMNGQLTPVQPGSPVVYGPRGPVPAPPPVPSFSGATAPRGFNPGSPAVGARPPQMNMNVARPPVTQGSPIVGGPSGVPATPPRVEEIVSQMLAAMQRPEIKNDPELMRFFVKQLQPLLQGIK